SCLFFVFFFFSSRRRHTRFSRDWSSDVCSSDLVRRPAHGLKLGIAGAALLATVLPSAAASEDALVRIGVAEDGHATVSYELAGRSEERRVGKERRSRWEECH